MNVLHIDRPLFPPGSLKAYLVAGGVVAVATLLRLMLTPWVADVPFIVFFPASILIAFLCGSAAGFLATALSVLSAWLFIFPPELSYFAISRTALFLVGTVTVVAVIGLMRAATADVRRLNETLRISEAKFRGLLETAPDAMVIIDAQRRIALINARTEMLFGYPRAELLDKPVERLLTEQSRGPYLAQLEAFMAGPGATQAGAAQAGGALDLQGLCEDGRVFPIDVSLAHLDTGAGILVSLAIRDMTARRQIEARLAEASKAKSDFLARVSHELRTPLNAIIGFSELIRDAVIAPLDARYREYGGDINGAGRHLLNIINDILDISKIEDGRLELRDEIVSLSESAEACRRLVAAMAEAAGVALSIDMPSALPRIRADQIRFRQILLNLMSNAVKFTPVGGQVSVSAAILTEGAVITVEDTGIGMNAEDIAIALEPFRQIDSPLSRRFNGTGLGLPLAKALTELHGGGLDIQSMPDRGTTVRIRLPLERIVSAAA